jgi:hypothetical protein
LAPIFNKYVSEHNSYQAVVVFAQAVTLKVQDGGEWNLRLILNLMHYHDHHGDSAYAGLSEQMRDNIIPFIQSEPEVVVRVVEDSDQLNRKAILSAFYQYVDQFPSSKLQEHLNPAQQKLMNILKSKNIR